MQIGVFIFMLLGYCACARMIPMRRSLPPSKARYCACARMIRNGFGVARFLAAVSLRRRISPAALALSYTAEAAFRAFLLF